VRNLLADGARLQSVLVWLDDLERFTGSGLSDSELQTLLNTQTVVVVATIRASEYAKLQPTGENIKPPGWEVAAWFDKPIWLTAWSEAELDRLADNTPDRTVIAEARKYGLSGYLGGAPLVDGQLDIAAAQNPIGLALVRAAVDWGRVGMTQPISSATLAILLPDYVALRHLIPLEEQVKSGLDWATQPLNHTVALLREEAEGLCATDLVVDRHEQPRRALRRQARPARPAAGLAQVGRMELVGPRPRQVRLDRRRGGGLSRRCASRAAGRLTGRRSREVKLLSGFR
jgi:hypothetical protein